MAVRQLPVRIPRADCDLTGVTIRHGEAGVVVPPSGGLTAIVDTTTGGGSELTVEVDPHTGDVLVRGSS